MDIDVWTNNILEIIKKISDKDYQKEAWFSNSIYACSPEEIYCELLDDFLFEKFLTDGSIVFEDRQKILGLNLLKAMYDYSKSSDYIDDPKRVYEDPQWDAIRKMAIDFLNSFKT